MGMQDNWSQVRYAASVANRSLLQALSPADREQFYPRLLPRMCLNRWGVNAGTNCFVVNIDQRFIDCSPPRARLFILMMNYWSFLAISLSAVRLINALC